MSSRDFISQESAFGAHNYHPLEVVIERASGVWVWDVEGNKYMDCLAAYSAVNQGHCHPKIIETLKEQADKNTMPPPGVARSAAAPSSFKPKEEPESADAKRRRIG